MLNMPMVVVAASFAACAPGAAGEVRADPLPELVVDRPGTRIDHSCRVVIAPGAVMSAAGTAAAIEIAADGITVEFAPGSVLRGAASDRPLDEIAGVGIRIDGHANVTLRHAAIAGFKAGVHATRAPGLEIDGLSVESGFAQRLKSTPQAEDASDWLWPHRNDENQWLASYGAAVYVEDSSNVTLHDIVVRRSQNGIVLDRVDGSRVYDNDCSFLSGWGLAMWRSGRNTIARNALDFCIRGYSHGVYNRGQDSAGLLVFEQCSGNTFAGNSATHCGDGFFGFAGREALGETWAEAQKAAAKPVDPVPAEEVARHAHAGCNDNLLIGNDFSYAAAHGIEMTFSFGNRFVNNRIAGNAICGVWGGFSAQTLIMGNTFTGNGEAGYGDERGAIAIEHGRDNQIVRNTFSGNALGVRLWAKNDSPLAKTPWGVANGESVGAAWRVPSARNAIVGNSFSGEPMALSVRNSTGTAFAANSLKNVRLEIDAERGTSVDLQPPVVAEPPAMPEHLPGVHHPVGARDQLAGRAQIIMTEWGPWDHASPLARLRAHDVAAGADVYEVLGVTGEVTATSEAGECGVAVDRDAKSQPDGSTVRVSAGDKPGVWPYTVRVRGAGVDRSLSGVLVNASWTLTAFAWSHDPMTDLPAWREEAKGKKAATATVKGIDFALGYKGPSRSGIAPEIDAAKIGPTKYGLIARTSLPLKAGRWKIRTMSDDGIRVIVDGTAVIERWNIHGPTPDAAVLTFDDAHTAEIEVEYFQNDGHAVLSVTVEPVEGTP